MAYTPEEYNDLLKEIANSGGDTPKMLELLQKLRDDYDEREGELKRYGEERDRREPEGADAERKIIREESREDDREDGGERRRAYDGDFVSREDFEKLRGDMERMRRAYVDRYFSTPKDAIREQKEDVRKDDRSDTMTFDDLFKDREG